MSTLKHTAILLQGQMLILLTNQDVYQLTLQAAMVHMRLLEYCHMILHVYIVQVMKTQLKFSERKQEQLFRLFTLQLIPYILCNIICIII